MAGYRVVVYRPARPYRRPRRTYRLRSRKGNGGTFPVVAIGAAVLLAGAGVSAKAVASPHGHARPAVKAAAGNAAATEVIAFARARVGQVPYVWGGTTDAGMDCSGLAQAAYAAAGVSIERTSQEQWASERHVPGSQVTAGDLVFFAGSDGTDAAPGHVGIVVDPEKHLMIDAYATGTYVRYDTYGLASSAQGLSSPVGFTGPGDGTSPPADVALGEGLAAAYGWSSGGQWTCLYDLWEQESGWQGDIANPRSGAFGIAQALGHGGSGAAVTDPVVNYPDGSAAYDVTVNEYPSRAANGGDARAQIEWGLGDIKDVYGTPCGAWKHEEADGWY